MRYTPAASVYSFIQFLTGLQLKIARWTRELCKIAQLLVVTCRFPKNLLGRTKDGADFCSQWLIT